jgi:hypothetical protein
MDKFGGLQRVTGRLVSHLLAGHFAQFFINQREQFGSRLGVPLLNGLEYERNVGHSNNDPQNSAKRNKKIAKMSGGRRPS